MLRDRLAEGAEPDRLAFVRELVRAEARALSLFQEGVEPAPGLARYQALSTEPADQISGNPALTTSGLRELAAALGLLGLGSSDGTWQVLIGPTSTGRDGVLKAVTPAGAETAIFFAANGNAAVQLQVNGSVRLTDPDVVMIHSTEPVASRWRSPRGIFGRTGGGAIRHVDMRHLLATSVDVGELEIRFRQAAAL
jgi:hypothetical protein